MIGCAGFDIQHKKVDTKVVLTQVGSSDIIMLDPYLFLCHRSHSNRFPISLQSCQYNVLSEQDMTSREKLHECTGVRSSELLAIIRDVDPWRSKPGLSFGGSSSV